MLATVCMQTIVICWGERDVRVHGGDDNERNRLRWYYWSWLLNNVTFQRWLIIMYHQRTSPSQYHLRPYQHDADDGRMLLRQHSVCTYDSLLRQDSVTSTRNHPVFHHAAHYSHRRQPDGDVLHRVWNNEHGGTPAAPESLMTSYPDDVMQQTGGVPSAVTSPPGPYDCKPPYSYISLIAMAIESSPRRRSSYFYFSLSFVNITVF